MKEKPEELKDQIKAKRRDFFFWLGRFVFFLFVLFFGILILIQLPPVQMWGARYISKKIAKTLNTHVSVGGFNLHPISDLSLKDVFIGSPDHPEDTLIMAKNFQVDFQRLWDFMYNKLTIDQVILDDAFLNIEKKAGDTLTNLDVAMLRLLPDRDTSKAPFVLDLEKISATSLQVNINDHTAGSLVKMIFPRADISLDTLDMAGQYISAEYLDFDEPLVHITKKPPGAVIQSSLKKEDRFWSFDVYDLNWTDGKFYLDDQTKPHDTSQVYGIDYAHLFIADLDIEVDSFTARGFDITGQKVKMHILHQNGFELNTLEASDIDISDQGIRLDELVIKTKDSNIDNSVDLNFTGFTDFKTFADSVDIHIPSADIRLQMMDLLSLAPGLGKVQFIADNRDKTIIMRGDIDGNINRLRVLGMDAGMGGISMTGDFRSRNLTKKGAALISLDLNNSNLSAAAMKDLFPRMKLPPVLNKLGQVRFAGKFDGYLDDFVAYGTFNTALGTVTMDMNLNIVQGLERARYSGTLSMEQFDLGAFIGNKDIGRVTMTGRVIEGTGLTAGTMNADITAVMSSAVYKGYTYRNARLDGQITDRLFSGTMDINDPNLDMHFEGTVDFRGRLPKLDFITRLDSVRFMQLGFGDQPIALSGIFDVDFTAGQVDEFQGTLTGENVIVNIKGVNYHLDSLSLIAIVDSVTKERFYHIESSVASGVFSGVFNPLTIPNVIHQYLHQHYPSTIGPPEKTVALTDEDQRMSWDLHIHDSGPWLDVAGLPGLELKNTYTHGTVDFRSQELIGFIQLPELHYGGFNVYGSSINFNESNGTIEGDVEVIAADFRENLFFEDVYLSGTGTDDSIRLRIKTDHIAEVIDELDLEILADPEDGNWTFSINPIRLDFLGSSWVVPSGNLIEIRKNEFNLENFELVSGDRRMVVNDINNKGLEAFITGFDVNYLNSLWLTDKFEFSGVYTLDLEIDNVYNIQQMTTTLHIPALKVNNEPYGEWILNAAMNDPQDSVKIDITMNNNEAKLTGKGAFLPPIKSIPKEKQNFLRLGIVATEFPLDFLEFLMGGNIRDTEGSVDLTLTLEGRVDKLVPEGVGTVYNGSTTIDYLGTAYSFHDQTFRITESMIDLSGTRLYDVEGNFAIVQGGITHRYLKDLGLDATVRSDHIIGLDVTSEENGSFYGRGIGSIDATFSGTIANPVMEISTRPAKGTHIYIPLSGAPTSTDRDFVIFLENGQLPASKMTRFNLSGVQLTMHLEITPDAIVEIVFDANTGDVLRAQGYGNLDVHMSRTGNLSLVGEYTIEEGDYLFTNFRIVRKPFEIEKGSTISWNGDPYDAELNVRALYDGLTASVYPLIVEFIPQGSAQIVSEAREKTEVHLTMILKGSLLHPDIGFDIDFPNLSGALAGYADEKLKVLQANQDAMLSQVVGLLLTRSFITSTSDLSSGLNWQKGIDNTLGEIISSALSSLLSGLLGELVNEGNVISSIDLLVGLDVSLFDGEVDPVLDEGDSYYVNVPIQFFDDRLTLDIGGSYITGSALGSGEYIAGNVTLEYDLSPDGSLKVRAFNRNNLTFEGRRNKFGLGFGYRREAESLPGLIREIFGPRKKKKPEKEGGDVGSGG